MDTIQNRIDRIKYKQASLRELKLKNSIKDKTPEEFDHYINSLSGEEKCKYMTGVSEIINLCNNKHECKFKGEIYKSFTSKPKKECSRERVIKYQKMLAH